MEIKQHVKGVLWAIVSATVLLFAISFFVGEEIRVSKSYVINAPADSVFNFIRKPRNFGYIIDGGKEFKLNYLKGDQGVQYEGFDGNLHTFKYKSFPNQKGAEIIYSRDGEDQAVFKYKASQKESGTVLSVDKIWRISPNPLVKIISMGSDEDLEAGMQKEIKSIKKELE